LKYIIIIALIFSILLIQNIPQSLAYEVEYEVHGPRISGIPTVCTIEPDPAQDEYLTEYYVEKILTNTRHAIGEWETQLKHKVIYEKNKANWEINYVKVPLEEQDKFDYDTCTVFITFEPKPQDKSKWFSYIGESQYEAGNTGRTTMITYYAGIQFCRSQDSKFYYYDPCYTDRPRTFNQIATSVKHEFGHALGLGHYISDDNAINLKWARGGVPSPSIMAIFSHQVTKQNTIHTIDIDTVYSLYGEGGFLRDEPKPFLGFESFTTLDEQYFKDKNKPRLVTITGNLTSDLYRQGVMVVLTVTKPDNTQEKISAIINPNGGFEALYSIDQEKPEGIYQLKANYIGYNSEEITFEVLSIQNDPPQTLQKIPTWIKNTAGWWSEDRIGENDFVEGIRYLIEEDIIKIQEVKRISVGEGRNIPDWVKTTTGWWANDLVPEDDFIRGMQYLIQEGIISFN